MNESYLEVKSSPERIEELELWHLWAGRRHFSDIITRILVEGSIQLPRRRGVSEQELSVAENGSDP